MVLLLVLRMREGSVGVRREDLPLLALVGLLGITLGPSLRLRAHQHERLGHGAPRGHRPIMTTLLAALVGLERSGRRHWTAACIGLAGVVLIVVGGTSGAQLGANLLGDACALGMAFFSSASALPIRPLLRRYSALRILTYEMSSARRSCCRSRCPACWPRTTPE